MMQRAFAVTQGVGLALSERLPDSLWDALTDNPAEAAEARWVSSAIAARNAAIKNLETSDAPNF